MERRNFIKDYLTESFGSVGRLTNSEFIMPSLFLENDYKRHMSVNADTGLWQCFKSGERGNFIKLYAINENLNYRQAEAELLFKSFLSDDDFLKEPPREEIKKNVNLQSVLEEGQAAPLSPESYDEHSDAWLFLMDRKLFNLEDESIQYYICKEGPYKDRIVIPFTKNECIFYFQARSINNNLRPKYLNPPVDYGVRPSAILYPFDETENYVVVCEGPLDAISLQIQGVNATSTLGCSISDHQIDILNYFGGKVIIAYDNDSAGERGLDKADSLRKQKLMSEIYAVAPPKEFKDWNDAHIKGINLKDYIEQNTNEYTFNYKMEENLKRL